MLSIPKAEHTSPFAEKAFITSEKKTAAWMVRDEIAEIMWLLISAYFNWFWSILKSQSSLTVAFLRRGRLSAGLEYILGADRRDLSGEEWREASLRIHFLNGLMKYFSHRGQRGVCVCCVLKFKAENLSGANTGTCWWCLCFIFPHSKLFKQKIACEAAVCSLLEARGWRGENKMILGQN